MGKIVLSISGMHCTSCASLIEDELKEQKGVLKARVDYATKKAVIEHDDTIQESKIQQVIKGLGYEANNV